MPLYEFECAKCSHVFEELCSIHDKQKPACPSCKSRKVSKLMSSCAVRSTDGGSAMPSGGGGAGGCGGCSGGNCATCH